MKTTNPTEPYKTLKKPGKENRPKVTNGVYQNISHPSVLHKWSNAVCKAQRGTSNLEKPLARVLPGARGLGCSDAHQSFHERLGNDRGV